MRVLKTETLSMEIRPSLIHGEGLFALRAFKPGETICRAKGNIVNSRSRTSYQLNSDKHFEPTGIVEGMINALAKVNHSCDPNSQVEFDSQNGFLILKALKHISKYEEITCDYCITESEMACPFECHCGKPNCRKFIDCKRNSETIRGK